MVKVARKNEIDFTSGSLLKKMIIYALPIIGVNVLQLLFTTADLSVLGIFTKNDNALAAVGAATPIVNLLIGFFTGLSVAVNVLIARCVGAHKQEDARKLVGTSVFISIVFGIAIMIFGAILSEQILIWTNCDPDVLPYATTYLRIYFLGMPVIMLYNFCAAILRSVGDTLRPLIFLIIGGVINVVLNIFFIVVVGLDIEGVAIATVVSNGISAICACYLMLKNDGYAKLERKHFRIYKEELLQIFKIGLPVAVSKCLFSFANVLVSAQLNALGDTAMAAHSITKEFDGFILETMHGIGAATIAVVSQNYGAKKPERIKKVLCLSLFMAIVLGIVLGLIFIFVGRTLCSIMTSTEAVLDLCMVRITTVSILYLLLGILNVLQETLRGIGYSFTATLESIFANIFLRFIYLYFVYPYICIKGNIAHNLRMLYLLYPASWFIASIFGAVLLFFIFKKVKGRLLEDKKQLEPLKLAKENQNNLA